MIIKTAAQSFSFNTSIILPFYKKVDIFEKTLHVNQSFFQRRGIEIVICMDESSEEEKLLHIINAHPNINWKVLINRRLHAWRNPVKVLNVGIRHATKEYLLLMDPESELYTDILWQFNTYAQHYGQSYFTGNVVFTDDNPHHVRWLPGSVLPYGSLYVRREHLLAIRGYDEQYTAWGGDDDNIRARLEAFGLKRIHIPEALLVHREKDNTDGHQNREIRSAAIPLEMKKGMLYPSRVIANDENWGLDFSELLYDYNQRKS